MNSNFEDLVEIRSKFKFHILSRSVILSISLSLFTGLKSFNSSSLSDEYQNLVMS